MLYAADDVYDSAPCRRYATLYGADIRYYVRADAAAQQDIIDIIYDEICRHVH